MEKREIQRGLWWVDNKRTTPGHMGLWREGEGDTQA